MFMSIFSFFAGVLLGQRFKVLILLPAVGLVFIVAMVLGVEDAWPLLLGAALVTVALQAGYLSGGLLSARTAGYSTHGSNFVFPLLVSLAAIIATTVALSVIDTLLNAKHLVMGYLLPATVVAIYYGSSFAIVTSFAGGIMAAYFLLPPKFSFQIADTLNVAELGFFMLLALIASRAVAAIAHDR